MVAPPFVLECITPNCLAHGNEGEATPTTTQSGFFILSYMVETRQTYSQPKIRLIIFLKEDLASLTTMSEGAVTGTTAGMMEGPGGPRFLRKQKPYKLSTNHMHMPCIVLSNFSIQSRSSFSI